MDKPIFTLTCPGCRDIAVNRTGEWIAIKSNRGISVYDQYGSLRQHQAYDNSFNQITNFQIHDNELGYFINSHFHIVTLPDLEPVDSFDLTVLSTENIVFNESWVIMADTISLTIAKHRRDTSADHIVLPEMFFPRFLDENVIFGPATRSNRNPIIYDLVNQQIIEELPRLLLDISPDRRFYLYVDLDSSVQALRAFTDGDYEVILPHDRKYRFHDDRTHLISVNNDGHVVLHELETGNIVADYTLHNLDTPRAISGEVLVSMSNDGWIKRFDLMSGAHLNDVVQIQGFPFLTAASGKYVVFVGYYLVTVFDMDRGRIIWERPSTAMRLKGERGEWGHMMRASIHGSWVLVQTDAAIEIWDFEEDRLIAACAYCALYPCLSPPYLYFTGLTLSHQSKLVKFDIEQQTVLIDRDIAHNNALFLSEEFGLLMSGPLTDITVLDTETLSQQRNFQGSSSVHGRMKVASRNMVAMGDRVGVKIMSIEDGSLINVLPSGGKSYPVCITENEKLVVIIDENENNIVHLWNPYDTMEPLYSIRTQGRVVAAAFPDDNTLVTSHLDGTVNFWDITHIMQGLV